MKQENQILPAAAPVARLQRKADLLQRILVADDEPLLRQLYTEVLLDAGYDVDAAEDGQMAWDALQVNGYDLLITDNEMPNVTGVDLLKRIHAAHMSLPVIMATATYPGEEFIRYPWLQPDTTLIKPYSVAELLAAVREVLYANDGIHAYMAPPPIWQMPPPDQLRT